jgi:sodium/potassium-transporting ATPase subunit alpha
MAYGQIGMIQALAGFSCWILVYLQSGWHVKDLPGIRTKWDSAAVNDLADSYGQEWVTV